MSADRDERNRRYRAGLCVDCGEKPLSPGRTRCEDCYSTYIEYLAQGIA